jgi:hypothetical protein
MKGIFFSFKIKKNLACKKTFSQKSNAYSLDILGEKEYFQTTKIQYYKVYFFIIQILVK